MLWTGIIVMSKFVIVRNKGGHGLFVLLERGKADLNRLQLIIVYSCNCYKLPFGSVWFLVKPQFFDVDTYVPYKRDSNSNRALGPDLHLTEFVSMPMVSFFGQCLSKTIIQESIHIICRMIKSGFWGVWRID